MHLLKLSRIGSVMKEACVCSSVLLEQKFGNTRIGAYPCEGFITKEEYLDALRDLDIDWSEI